MEGCCELSNELWGISKTQNFLSGCEIFYHLNGDSVPKSVLVVSVLFKTRLWVGTAETEARNISTECG